MNTEDSTPSAGGSKSTAGADYAQRLSRLESARWRRVLNVQAPYRWNIRRLNLGRTLDVGCGLGRNLAHLDGHGVGVDHNAEAIAVARERGLTAYTVEEFHTSAAAVPGSFDSLLLAHVVEHLSFDEAVTVLAEYLPYLSSTGRICLITPQERGYRTDATHVRFVDFAGLERLVADLGFRVQRRFSFPFPRAVGKVFAYNEFVLVADRSRAGH